MRERGREAMRLFLTAEVTRRFGPTARRRSAATSTRSAADLAEVAAAELPAETEPAFFLLEGDGR